MWSWDKQETGRAVQLFFVDLDSEQEVEQSFFDLKTQLHESTARSLRPQTQARLLRPRVQPPRDHQPRAPLRHRPQQLPRRPLLADPARRPLAAPGYLPIDQGWRETSLGDLSLNSSCEFETNVRKWISSPGEKMDLWAATIAVDAEEGAILRLDPLTNAFQPIHERTIKEHFLSYLSIGHHAQLIANYEARRKDQGNSLVDKMVFNVESLKKFCCIGKPSLETSTGVLSIIFQDEKGYEQ